MTLGEAIREFYLPRVREMVEEHERWCEQNPGAAAFLGALPNGDWRSGVLAGEERDT